MELVQRGERVIVGHGLLADGDVVLVAVSGGIDSIVLMHVLHALSAKHKWHLVVAHLNHRLRGRAADLDEKFVVRQAAQLGLRCETAREDVKKFAKNRKLSVEMAARKLRHEFLVRTARGLGIGKIALAHHADDQVELFFLRLFRGAGTQGLGGMQLSSPSPSDPRIRLVRPLLRETKATLREFAQTEKIPFREDATNASPDILRNRIRRKLLPFIQRSFQPQLGTTVLRTMGLLHDEADFVTHEAVHWLSERSPPKAFNQLHIALQRRVIQLELLAHGIAPQFERVETLRNSPGKWSSIDAATLGRCNANGRIETRASRNSPSEEETTLLLADNGGTAAFGPLRLRWRTRAGRKLPPKAGHTEIFDADAVGESVVLRHWRAGDRFHPIGMARPVKLQDLFVNQKIPRECRHKVVLATTTSGEIFWVEGLRIGESFKLTRATKRTLEWRWRPQESQVAASKGEC